MRLKGLELQGFKSFADRTVLNFENGITGIVGPNGSGKSNISDAMRWVMGEQSAKQLRGGNMQDVIFSGTQKRKPLGFAEVSLIIDNTDKQLPVDFDEVVVTRRVFRSGESEYYINKSSVRLKDIHELFMDTGVGRDGYSIIGQGKISEIINTKSEDRRTMFEEAAGITKFRYRKEEAERKLAHTNDNVLRVNDIISEIEGQIGPLKQQSEKAKKYLNLRDRLKVLEVNLALKNISKYKSLLEEYSEQSKNIDEELLNINKSIEQNEKETEEIFKKINEAEKFAEENREMQLNSTKMLSDFKSDIEVLKSRIDGNNENIDRIRSEISELNVKYDEIEKEIVDEENSLEILNKNREEIDGEIDGLQKNLNDFDSDTASISEYVDRINTDIIENLNEISGIRSKISNYDALIQSSKNRAESIKRELDEKNGSLTNLENEVSNLQSKYDNLLADNKIKKEELENRKISLAKAEQNYNSLLKLQSDDENNIRQFVTRLNLLKDMEKSFDNYSKSVKAVMNEHKRGSLSSLKLYGTVAGLLSVEEKYSTAIEVTLGAATQNIVTETENDAKLAIEYLKRTKQGRATFLPVSSAKGGFLNQSGLDSLKGYIGIASNLVSYDKKFEKIVTGLLGRTLVVDNIDNAILIAKKYSYGFKIVTLQGDVLSPGGSMSGGSRKNLSGIFSRANEIIELEKNIKALELKTENNRENLSALLKNKNEESENVNTLSVKLSENNSVLIKTESDLSHLKAFLDSVTEGKNALLSELTQIDAQISDMSNQIKVYEGSVDTLNSKISAMEKDVEIKRESLGSQTSKRFVLTESIDAKKSELNEILKDIEVHNQKILMTNSRKQEIFLNISQKNKNIEELNDVNDDLNDDIEFKNEQIEGINEELKNISETIKNSEIKRKEAQDSIKSQQEENKKLRENQLLVQQQMSKFTNKKEKTESDLEYIINKLWEDYELTTSSAADLKTDLPSDAQKQVSSIKDEIKSLGNINIDAIEEYNQVGERYEFLKTQRDDLVDAKANLEQVISDMVLIMKQQFSEKFNVINKYFGETFSELFGGGKAELLLTDPNDILQSGVDINVQPPGKAVKTILQLSGGEQAFVSIALLFAILKVRPSPFCVLDEIEAALDDVNVFRFADYLKKFCKNSQFIVVTHRRGTMEAANTLYGVTMQEQGVSRLLSLNIDEVTNAVR